MSFKSSEHFLVPKHVLLSKEQVEELIKKYGLKPSQFPRIKKTDPALKELDAKRDEVVKIVRDSPTAGKTVYYRRVV